MRMPRDFLQNSSLPQRLFGILSVCGREEADWRGASMKNFTTIERSRLCLKIKKKKESRKLVKTSGERQSSWEANGTGSEWEPIQSSTNILLRGGWGKALPA